MSEDSESSIIVYHRTPTFVKFYGAGVTVGIGIEKGELLSIAQLNVVSPESTMGVSPEIGTGILSESPLQVDNWYKVSWQFPFILIEPIFFLGENGVVPTLIIVSGIPS